MNSLLDTLASLRIADFADLLVVALLFWVGIAWLRQTRARLALLGLVILGGIYVLARQIGMPLTAWILQSFVAVSVLVVVVVFQEDIRRLFEQIAMLGLRRRPSAEGVDSVDTLTRALAHLANVRRGALVVLPGRDPLERHLDGGIELDAKVSEPLLLSLFDPHSPGHDGAVIHAGDRVLRFAVHLPLSTNHALLGQRGTRHAAGLGLAERSDALCLVVSEERGTVSVARSGQLRTLDRPEEVGADIRSFLADLVPSESSGTPWRRFAGGWREAAMASALAIFVWLIAVPGSDVIEVERDVSIDILDLPSGYELVAVEPAEVRVTLSGPRRDVLVLEDGELRARVNTVLLELGRRTFPIGPDQISHPPRTQVVDVSPDSVRISLRPTPATAN